MMYLAGATPARALLDGDDGLWGGPGRQGSSQADRRAGRQTGEQTGRLGSRQADRQTMGGVGAESGVGSRDEVVPL